MAYNGWTNKETWLVNLWLGEGLTMDQEDGINVDAEYIEDYVNMLIEDLREERNGFLTDMLNCALGEINYEELASHYEPLEDDEEDDDD